MIDLILELGLMNNTFQDDAKNEWGYKFRAGYENVYLWASEEDHEIRLLGQGLANTTVNGLGLGVRHSWQEFSIFVEAGYGWVDMRPYEQKQFTEVNYTYLVGRHAVEGRPIPVDCAKEGCFETSYTLDDAPMLRVGVDYQVINHVKISASYRWMESEEYIAIWDEERHAQNKGWWEERINRNMGAAEFGIFLTW